MGRILIFTGKGGVGKTSVAAAHAILSAREGKNTLLVSADMAHNLGDIFEREVGRHTRQAGENLSLLELDPDLLMQEEFPEVKKAVAALLGSSGAALVSGGDDFMIPGFENLFSLMKIKDIYESGEYERIIVDCAPTGETLSLLKLPELLTWYMEKFFPVGKVMVRVLAPISKAKYKVELPTRKAMNEIEEMHGQMVRLQEFLKNPEICTVRLVCVPEKMVVEETKRSFMYLNLYDYPVDGVFINRILPENTGSEFMDRWQEIQKKYVDELERVFAQVPVTKIPWYKEEVRGEEAIGRLAEAVSKMSDPFAVNVQGARENYTAIPDGYCLNVSLPGADPEEISVSMHDMDVDIRVKNYNRRIPLPNTLRGAKVTAKSYEEGCLKICLKGKEGNRQ